VLSADEMKPGLLVRHDVQSAWGLGRIVQVDDARVYVYFKDVEGSLKDAVKLLSRDISRLSVAETQEDVVLDHLPSLVQGGKVVPPTSTRLTEAQARDVFVAKYRRFDDPEYLAKEREPKWKLHEQTRDALFGADLRKVLQGGSAESGKLLTRLFKQAGLLAPQEMAALVEAFKDGKNAASWSKTLVAFIESPDHAHFGALVEATGELPDEPGKSRALSWSTVTLLPFLARPDVLMFLKPDVTRKVADVFAFDLAYTPRTHWPTYERLLTLGYYLLDQLRPLGATDLIDVHAFMWTVAASPEARARRKKKE
jgi:hypothetical protein